VLDHVVRQSITAMPPYRVEDVLRRQFPPLLPMAGHARLGLLINNYPVAAKVLRNAPQFGFGIDRMTQISKLSQMVVKHHQPRSKGSPLDLTGPTDEGG